MASASVRRRARLEPDAAVPRSTTVASDITLLSATSLLVRKILRYLSLSVNVLYGSGRIGGREVMNINAKTAIVTGSAGGIGRATAVMLAARGEIGRASCRDRVCQYV